MCSRCSFRLYLFTRQEGATCRPIARLGGTLRGVHGTAATSPVQPQTAADPAHLLQQFLKFALHLLHGVCAVTVQEDSLPREAGAWRD